MTDREYEEVVKLQYALRGQIIGAFAQIEYILLHIAMQARLLKEYWPLELRYHRQLPNRITQARNLFGHDGPLKKYRDEAQTIFDQLEPIKEDRDFLAHALGRAEIKGVDISYKYLLLHMQDGDGVVLKRKCYNPAELEELAEKTTRLAQIAVTFFRKVYTEQGLEELWTFGNQKLFER